MIDKHARRFEQSENYCSTTNNFPILQTVETN